MRPKIIIVDDELHSRERIKRLIKVTDFEIIGEAQNMEGAVEIIDSSQPDVLFLDINLGDHTGFDVLKNIKPNKHLIVIFITAYDEFAIRAFDFFALDYILKPFKDERFLQSLYRAKKRLAEAPIYPRSIKLDRVQQYIEQMKMDDSFPAQVNKLSIDQIPVKLGDRIYFVKTDDIAYIRADGYYLQLFANSNKHIVRNSLTKILDVLDPKYFLRIHRSTIVNINFLKEIKSNGLGDYQLIMKDHAKLILSKSYKKPVLKTLGLR